MRYRKGFCIGFKCKTKSLLVTFSILLLFLYLALIVNNLHLSASEFKIPTYRITTRAHDISH